MLRCTKPLYGKRGSRRITFSDRRDPRGG